MNRRILALLMAVLMVLTFVACKRNDVSEETVSGVISGKNDGDLDNTPAVEVQPEETEATAETEENAATEETGAIEETAGTEETEPNTETATPSTEPEEETTVPSAPAVGMTEFEWYNALSGEEQMAYMESFDSIEAFFAWYNNAKAEHEELHPDIEIGDGVIDLGDLVGGNG